MKELRRVVVFNYNSRFCRDIVKTIEGYNNTSGQDLFSVEMHNADRHTCESEVDRADVIIHSGGDGRPLREDCRDIPKLYICYSHEWKAKREGGRLTHLRDFIKGVYPIDILEDDEILGKAGKMPIMKYHSLAVISAPSSAKVLATSRVRDRGTGEFEIIEALRYPDGSVSVQGHPEEGSAAHIIYNFFQKKNGSDINGGEG